MATARKSLPAGLAVMPPMLPDMTNDPAKSPLRWGFLIVAAFVLNACFSPSSRFGEEPSPTPPEPTVTIPFPHPADYALPTQHGETVKAFGFTADACAICHGASLEGESGPACRDCHATYPHDAGWAAPDQHGAFVGENGSSGCATQCHGANLDGGLSGTACTDCHTLWPHDQAGWTDGAVHGAPARTLGPTACTGCHQTDDPPGGFTGVDCVTCHPSLLAHWEANWPADGHGGYARAVDVTAPTECVLCHGAQLTGGEASSDPTLSPAPPCASCHPSYPVVHSTAGWGTASGHGVAVTNALYPLTQCQLCHGDSYEGRGGAPSCYQCHANYPEPHLTSDGTQNPSWHAGVHGTTLWANGGAAATGKAAAAVAGCTDCHGTPLTGGSTGLSCYNSGCHPSYPHAPPTAVSGATFTDAAWGGVAGGHGSYVGLSAFVGKVAVTAIVESQCATCHHLTLESEHAPSCTGCHGHDPVAVYPHPEGWYDNTDAHGGLHGSVVVAAGGPNAAKAAGCLTACHGKDGASGIVGSAQGCPQCHAAYPHLATDWTTATSTTYPAHAREVLSTQNTATKNDDQLNQQKFSQCTPCHGGLETFSSETYPIPAAWQSGESGVVRCYQCHYYPHTAYLSNGTSLDWTATPGPHVIGVVQWYMKQTAAPAPYVAQTCGTAGENVVGCHTDGPTNAQFVPPPSAMEYCTLCHKVK
ncbi:MAG: hypothetical protein HYV02_05450 [Deltaproteobacteria bacterium]|nr:hypothetical protein [Deltaproteobacteria bacterium]